MRKTEQIGTRMRGDESPGFSAPPRQGLVGGLEGDARWRESRTVGIHDRVVKSTSPTKCRSTRHITPLWNPDRGSGRVWGSRSGGTAIAEPPATLRIQREPTGGTVDSNNVRGDEPPGLSDPSATIGRGDRKCARREKSGMMATHPRSAPPRDPNPRMLEIEARSEPDIGRKTSIDMPFAHHVRPETGGPEGA